MLDECASLLSMPWAMQPERLAGLVEATQSAVIAGRSRSKPTQKGKQSKKTGTIAVIPLQGFLAQRESLSFWAPRTFSLEAFGRQLDMALADDSISRIVIDIDSPGGSVYGVHEMASKILRGREKKSIVGIANSLAASAAYWIGSACSQLYVTPGGEVGSIGVYVAHQDWSKAFDEAGVKFTLISAGRHKVEGNPYEALAKDAKDFMQSRVDAYYSTFVRDVATGRGMARAHVRDGMGGGRVLGAADALKAGMVDGIATLDQVIQGSATRAKAGGRASKESATALESCRVFLKQIGAA